MYKSEEILIDRYFLELNHWVTMGHNVSIIVLCPKK